MKQFNILVDEQQREILEEAMNDWIQSRLESIHPPDEVLAEGIFLHDLIRNKSGVILDRAPE